VEVEWRWRSSGGGQMRLVPQGGLQGDTRSLLK
jgi:hypothetical protein